MTPYEAWWDSQPDLSMLKVFGARVCVKVTGKRRAKLDRHDFGGIFIGYTAADDNVRYIDVDSGLVKTSHHAIFDEAWYLQPHRPPMAQLLFEMGMELDVEEESEIDVPQVTPKADLPPITKTDILLTPNEAKNTPLPLRLSAKPMQVRIGARAAMTMNPYQGTCVEPRIQRLSIIDDMRLDRGETFAQVYLSPSAYHEAFEEEIDIRRWTNIDHHTAGLTLIQKDGRLILASIVKSTPVAKIPRWRTRCRGAWVMEVNGMLVQTTQDVERALKMAKMRGDDKCRITLAHPEIKEGLTSQGIPQLHIDQFNPRYILNLDHLVHQEHIYQASGGGGVFQCSFNNLTRGKLLKQDDWADWQNSEWLQLDQYYSQFMFGDPVKVKDRSNVFFLVWTYTIKDVDGRKKARCACDGYSRGGKVRVLDYTHSNCIDHVASRMFYALAAAENMQVWGADVGNAFAEAPPPKQGFYIQPDWAFKEWWIARGRKPIEDKEVIPVM
jgi:hypothetical protein